ncbi:hypothetical protein BSK49_19335 [Paenibacillus odorifer]|uniref:hypothetical protein n=1 Tax=Paenibacillus TaxID=44249 RepID=UPI00096D5A22|nr:hypothetical protein [Paenibacillus odorifer]OMD85671.1 hypothetical protein BSK49_19335 [Paenibacillus odorifer]
MSNQVRHFKAVMPSGDLIGLFQTNSGIMLLSQIQNVKAEFGGTVVELNKTEYDALLEMSKAKESVTH